ncbi:hypothetical protein BDQ17DRAFT_80810 [Cyathus striatus]|nr:hypothetical protein BDQ17DRAFT_80810 [Cyathus striatus]
MTSLLSSRPFSSCPPQHIHNTIMSAPQNPNAPPPPEYVKQMEKQIAREGTIEEKNLKHAIKDLSNAEKVKTKAAKSENKAEHALDKAGRNEHAALQALGKATNKHDIAVANVHAAENSLQVKHKEAEKLETAVQAKRKSVETTIKTHEDHKKEREVRLANLHADTTAKNSPISTTAADRQTTYLIPQALQPGGGQQPPTTNQKQVP